MSFLKRKTHKPQTVETITEPEQGFAQIAFTEIDTAIDNKLTAAEWRLWMYLMKIDRYGDKWRDLPVPTEIAVRLGMDRRTVEKAMFRLDELGLYSVRVQKWQGINSSAARAHDTAQSMKQAKKSREAVKPAQGEGGYLAQNAVNLPNERLNNPNMVNLPNERLNNPNRLPEALPHKDSNAPQTIKTCSDLIKTLSEGERENFLNFSLEKCKSLPKLPELPMKWIEAHSSELYAQFKSTPEATTATVANKDWTQHSDWEEWLQEMREGVPRFVALGTCFDRKMRRAIADWADERGLIWGTES